MSDPVPQVIGPYRLVRLLGRGGMGSVYRAYQPSLQRDVAVKLIKPELLLHKEHVDRFRREVLALARLSHPNVVKVIESGEQDGVAWYAMELVPGESLAELLRPGKPLALSRVKSVAEALLSALGYLHEQGFLHRDVKPSNVQVADTGVKLMDFGLVKDVAGTLVTEDGVALGTPRYMAPEVLLEGTACVGSDLYQTGVVIYEMLTARIPFEGTSLHDLVDRMKGNQAVRLRALRPDLPESLEAAVHHLLAGEPRDRPASARAAWDEVSAGLQAAMLSTTGMPVMVHPQRHSGTALASAGAKDRRVTGPQSAAPRRSWHAPAAIACGALAGLVMVAALGPGLRPAPVESRSASPSPTSPASSPAAVAFPPLPDELPRDRAPAGAALGGFDLGDEVMTGRRVTLPRGLAADARGWMFVGSSEGLSWYDGARWSSRALVPPPASFGILCADSTRGVWARLRLEDKVAGADSFLVRLDERAILDRVPLAPSHGRPSNACLDARGDLLVATSGRPLRWDRAARNLTELEMGDVRADVAGVFAGMGDAGAWSEDGVWVRSGGGWRAVALPGGAPGRLRGVSALKGGLWVCGERGAVALPASGAPVRVLDGLPISAAFDAGDDVVLVGPAGIFRGRAGQPERVAVPGFRQVGVTAFGAGRGGEVWALTSTPIALVRVTVAGAVVDALPVADPEAAEREAKDAPALWSLRGACIPYAWLDAGDTLAAGTRGKLLRIDARGTAPLVPLGNEVWPIDLWLPAPGKPLHMVWQKEGTSLRFLDAIDAGARARVTGVPAQVDGPIRVAPDGGTVYQGPFVPIVQLLESGIYVRFHGARPDLTDIQGVREHQLVFWKPAARAAGKLALPADYANGPFSFDPAKREAWYVNRDGRVVRRTLGEGAPGPAQRVTLPPGVDERAIAELEPSPDGSLLAYVLQPRATGRATLHVLDVARQDSRRIGTYLFDYAQPRWSPDGSALAFVRRGVDLADAQLAMRRLRAR